MINFIRLPLNLVILISVAVLLISACAQAQETSLPKIIDDNQRANTAALDDQQVIQAQSDHAIKREVTVTARVKKILPEDVRGLRHQRFLIELSNGSTVLIAHDLEYAPTVPIQPLDIICIHGEYIWNKLGGLIHWTHHSNNFKHESGWIDFKGQRYQ